MSFCRFLKLIYKFQTTLKPSHFHKLNINYWYSCFSEGCFFHVISLQLSTMNKETTPAANLSPPNFAAASLFFFYTCCFSVQTDNSEVMLIFMYQANCISSELLIREALEWHCTSYRSTWVVLCMYKRLHFPFIKKQEHAENFFFQM